MKPRFIMTIDVDPPFSPAQNFIIEDGVTSLLNLLSEYKVKATFFVPGIVAENFSAVIEEIVKQKHEVACHGLRHEPLEATLNVNKQIQMIKIATEMIESITGLKPVGFRAPLFKVNRNCWIALQKNGYVYDSSLVCSILYGNRKAFLRVKPVNPFYLLVPKTNENSGLLEIPVSANPFLPFPLGGGWLRIFGLRWIEIGAKIGFIFQIPVVFFIHPKDIVSPRTLYGLHWYNYRNTTNCIKMLAEIIRYARHCGAEFFKAYELAKLYGQNSEN